MAEDIKIRKPAPNEDLSRVEEARSELLPDMDELGKRASLAGEAWGFMSSDAGLRQKDLTPGNRLRIKSNALTELRLARPDLSDEELDKLATEFVDKFGSEVRKNS